MSLLDREKFSDPDWVADQLRLDWRERQFLTDDEATGAPLKDVATRKGKAIAHGGGTLSRFATEAALKHLQSAGWITCQKSRKIDLDTYTPVRGWMRLWELDQLLKAEMVMTLADFADLSFLRLADLLAAVPGPQLDENGDPIPLAISLAEQWVDYVLYWFGLDSGDAAARREAKQGISAAPASQIGADRSQDARLLLIDRRWLFARVRDLPDSLGEPELGKNSEKLLPGDGWLLLADIRSLRSANFDLDWLLHAYQRHRTDEGTFFYTFTDSRWDEAQTARKHAAVRIELNLAEPLRRFIHRNRKEVEEQ
ncbi:MULTISPECIES: hypothetical protein [Alphaproteobacteria]|uniref:hypothetical protein n=1 Tax=Alphaproteobacteria TaxID=28211 RepID=UPI00257BEA88|nr:MULTISPECIES: hypothetical protein [Alphaproteobacteria]MCV0429758.1 hypothetical protein [Roseibium sp.]